MKNDYKHLVVPLDRDAGIDGREAGEVALAEPHGSVLNRPTPLLKAVSVADVHSNPSAPPQFVWDGYVPSGVVTLMSAHGGIGKSTIGLMLAVCAAAQGRPLFGVDTVACKTLFVSLEDGQHIIRHRLAHICRTWAMDPQQLRDRLHIVDGTENPELFTAEGRINGKPTPSYLELRDKVQAEGIGLVIVDNASDAFGGDEIQRGQVRAFMRSLTLLAPRTDCAVLLLAHVDKNTSRGGAAEGGEGYSGSTAWHNSARSRIFMSRAKDGTVTVAHQKSNLGKLRDQITLTWPEDGLPMLDPARFGTQAQGLDDDRLAVVLLRLLAEFEDREHFCSPASQARNNVHKTLSSEPAFLSLKLKTDDTKRILHQCERLKRIGQLSYRAHGKEHKRWTVTPDGLSFAGLPPRHSGTSRHMDVAPCTDEDVRHIGTSVGGVGGARARIVADVAAALRPEIAIRARKSRTNTPATRTRRTAKAHRSQVAISSPHP